MGVSTHPALNSRVGSHTKCFLLKDATWRNLPFSELVLRKGGQLSPRGSKTSSPSSLGSQRDCGGHFPGLLAPQLRRKLALVLSFSG